jgi:nucleotide-binding universal stress UspA family protein
VGNRRQKLREKLSSDCGGRQMFKSVLAATDKITYRDEPVLAAARIARENNAKLNVIHVLESSSTKNRDIVKHFQSGKEILTSEAYETSVKVEMGKIYAEWLHNKDNYEIKVVTGFPWHEIVKYAREVHSDLIVIGPHASGAQEKGVAGKIGSTVEGVIKRERCPVMIVNIINPSRAPVYRNVLVGVDFSKSCACAVIFAEKLVNVHGGKLIIFHMVPVPPDPNYSQDDYASNVKTATRRLDQFCREYIKDVDFDMLVLGGALPHLEILKWAQKKDADAIVMGSHTKENRGTWYPGNAVERVSLQSSCPVIVITDPSALKPWTHGVSVKTRQNRV